MHVLSLGSVVNCALDAVRQAMFRQIAAHPHNPRTHFLSHPTALFKGK